MTALAAEHGPAAGPAGDVLLEVRDLRVRFGGVVALDGPSLTLERGQICGLIGPNGAGKTTLFNCVSRLYQPASGTIVFAGQDLLRLRPNQVAGAGISRTSRTSGCSRRCRCSTTSSPVATTGRGRASCRPRSGYPGCGASSAPSGTGRTSCSSGWGSTPSPASSPSGCRTAPSSGSSWRAR